MEGKMTSKAKRAGSFAQRRYPVKNLKFKEVKPNYKKNVLDIAMVEGRKVKNCRLPLAVFRNKNISGRNRFASITIDRELGAQAVSFVLEVGSKGDFPADFVLYCCDRSYHARNQSHNQCR